MNQFRKAGRIKAFFWTTTLLSCFALAACGDATATPTTAINTTPPVIGTAPVTPLAPRAFLVVTTGADTSGPTETTITSGTDAQTPKLATPTSTTPPGNIRNNWLRGLPCKAPCWENITPGKTTPDEAQTLLKKNSGIGKVQIENPNFGNKPVAFYLYQTDGNNSWGFISYHNEPKPAKIEIIKLEVDFYQPKDVFAFYGEPSHVIVIEKTNELGLATGEYKTYLVYLGQGLILSSLYTKEVSLTPESEFNEIYFFIPGQAGLDILDTQGELNGKLLVGWEGFKDAKYYCRYQVQTGIKTC